MEDLRVFGCDQSLRASGLCVLENGNTRHLETFRQPEKAGWPGVQAIVKHVVELVDLYQPQVFAMEDYAYSQRSSSYSQLVEMGGCLKWHLYDRGYRMGHEAILKGEKVLLVQVASNCKKFCLGGDREKDSSYLLKVFQRLQKTFEDDNQADAYMHAWYAAIRFGVLAGRVPLENLEKYQIEALISRGIAITKVMSMTKALKQPPEVQMQWVSYN